MPCIIKYIPMAFFAIGFVFVQTSLLQEFTFLIADVLRKPLPDNDLKALVLKYTDLDIGNL